jgi:hypothetical protein
VPGNAYPSFGTFEEGLSVGLFGVGLFAIVAGEERVRVRTFGCFHRGGRRREVLEKGSLAVFVANLVALVDNAAFHLAGRIAVGKMTVFLVAKFEDAPKMCRAICASYFSDNVRVLANGILIPTTLFACPSKACPFNVEGSLRLGV